MALVSGGIFDRDPGIEWGPPQRAKRLGNINFKFPNVANGANGIISLFVILLSLQSLYSPCLGIGGGRLHNCDSAVPREEAPLFGVLSSRTCAEVSKARSRTC